MIFPCFLEFHLKGLPSLFPFMKFSISMCKFTAASFCAGAIHIPVTNTEVPCGEAVLPAVLVVLSVENLLLVLLGGDVVLPLLLTVTVLPTHPAVEVHSDFRIVCWHVDLLPVFFTTVTGCLITFFSFLVLQPEFIKLLYIMYFVILHVSPHFPFLRTMSKGTVANILTLFSISNMVA